MPRDASNGYEAIAEAFMAARSDVGVDIVRQWAAPLPAGASILDVGAGSGVPLTATLIEAGFDIYALDASPTLVAAFQQRFPDVPIACEAVEDSTLFDQRYDGIVAIGLVFLLPPEGQHTLIRRMAAALNPGGTLLFSAPHQICQWHDLLTGKKSQSLGEGEYKTLLQKAGLTLVSTHTDDGGSFYYQAARR